MVQKARLPPLPDWEGGPVHYMTLSSNGTYLAICCASLIFVYRLETQQVIILQGHIGRDNQVAFMESLDPEWIVSISDDRRFKGRPLRLERSVY